MKKSLTISLKTWQRLLIIKAETAARSMDEVINGLIDSKNKKRGESK